MYPNYIPVIFPTKKLILESFFKGVIFIDCLFYSVFFVFSPNKYPKANVIRGVIIVHTSFICSASDKEQDLKIPKPTKKIMIKAAILLGADDASPHILPSTPFCVLFLSNSCELSIIVFANSLSSGSSNLLPIFYPFS